MRRICHNKAQSTLEYILILTGVVALIIFAAGRWIRPSVNQALNDSNTLINNTSSKL